MRVNPFTSAFAEIGQFFRRSTTDKNQALSDFSIPRVKENRVKLTDKAIQKLSDTETNRVGTRTTAASSYFFIERRVPKVELLDGAASAFFIHNNLKFLRQKKTTLSIVKNLSFKSSFLDKQIKSFLKINEKLSSLKNAVETLSLRESFNIKSAKSSDPDALTATTSVKSPVSSQQINISQLAGVHQLVSDTVDDPFAGLGASGTIQINGFEVIIDSSDSLDDIKDKINFGEDLNKNGILDLGEDINNNGELDIFHIPSTPYAKGIYIIEDINGDNIIQGTEDLNDNELLDGGITELKVVAFISDNRLFLNSLSDGRKISLQDDNDILLNLGFFELDRFTNSVIKEQQLDPNTFENLNKLPSSSSLTVNGNSFKRESNNISDIIPETTLHLKDTSSKDISLSISIDITEAMKNIKSFVNVYNDTIKFLNKELAFSKVLEENIATQKIRNGLNDKVGDDVLNADQKFNNLNKIGITGQNQQKNTFNQVAIKNLVTNFKKDISNILPFPSKGSNSIFAGLDKIGIRTTKDDTLRIDENNLEKALKNNTEKVITLFADASSGIAEKLNDLIDILTRPESGTIALQVDKINNLITDSPIVSENSINKAYIKAAQLEQSAIGKTIVSIKV